jgi:hypothetical protein
MRINQHGVHPGVHVHQGGTVLTYCGLRTEGRVIVAWESASKSDCPGCRAHFEAELTAGRSVS